jgi:hypothetical protein
VDICVCGRHITHGADKCFHLGVAAREFEVQAHVCCLEGEGRRGRLHENDVSVGHSIQKENRSLLTV